MKSNLQISGSYMVYGELYIYCNEQSYRLIHVMVSHSFPGQRWTVMDRMAFAFVGTNPL